MDFVGDLRKAWKASVNPSSNTKKYTWSDALRFYYRVVPIPLILSLVITVFVYYLFGPAALTNFSSMYRLFGGSTGGFNLSELLFSVGFIALTILVLTPIGIVVDAAVLHFISGRIFKILPKDYNKTSAAVMFGELPQVIFYWLGSLPYIGIFILVVIDIWGIVVEIISLSKQHSISGWQALGAYLVTLVVVVVVVLVVTFGFIFAAGRL